MSKERTDDFLKWRGLLDQPDGGLEQVLDDREATWQKLADRLGERRRDRLTGYRVAAACLLFVLIVPAFRLFQDRRNPTGAHQAGHRVDLLPSAQRRSADPGDRSTPASAARQQGSATPLAGQTSPIVRVGPTVADRSSPVVKGRVGPTVADRGNASPTDRLSPIVKDRVGPAVGVQNQADGAARTQRFALGQRSAGARHRANAAALATARLRPSGQVRSDALGSAADQASSLPGFAEMFAPDSIMAAPPDLASQRRLPSAPSAKQLKVVHQNEIRGGNSPSPAVGAAGSNRLMDLFRPAPQLPSSGGPAEDPALLKIKLTPSN